MVTVLPDKHHQKSCKEFGEIEIACEIAYNSLKDQAIQPNFSFAKQYDSNLQSLQSKFDNSIIAESWPSQKTAREAIKSIRRRFKM